MMNINEKASDNIRKPDETGGFMFSSGIKIFDPNTEQVFLNKRGDS